MKYKEIDGKYECPVCFKLYKKLGISAHFRSEHLKIKLNPNPIWNKGLTKETDNRLISYGLTISKSKKGIPGKKHSTETKEKLSKLAIKNGLGGTTQSRWIRYNGKTLGSSYELKVAKSLDLNGIKWDTCKKFNYIDPFGKTRTYTPDFFLPDYNVYLDPKNDFLIEKINPSLGFNDCKKIKLASKQNGIKVVVINKNQLDWKEIKDLIECSTS